MTRSLLALAVTAAVLAAGSTPAAEATGRQRPTRTIRTRAQGGPAALGGVSGTQAGDMVLVNQQRARRSVAASQKRMTGREKLLAARDRQLGQGPSAGFASREQAATYTRARARLTQLRTFAVAFATGIGGGFLAKAIGAIAALQSAGYRDPLADPGFGNVFAQMFDHQFAIGAVIGAGITLVIGTVRAAQLRRRAAAIERGEADANLARMD